MTPIIPSETAPVRGRLDAEGRLLAADEPLSELHRRAGGEDGGMLAIPQVAALARLARRLGIVISRPVMAAEEDRDLELWIRAQPVDGGVELAITAWNERPVRTPVEARAVEREGDFLRAGADWTWETDAQLRFTAVSPAAAAAAGRGAGELIGAEMTQLFSLVEDQDGRLPLLSALAERHSFDGQIARLRGGGSTYRLAGVPLVAGDGSFAGFRGTAVVANQPNVAWTPDAPRDAPAFGERLDQALRNPLDHIIANAEAIGAAGDGPIDQHYAGYAGDIAAAGRHLLALVDDLVDLHAIERPDFKPAAEPIDLADIARRASGLLSVRAAARGVQIDGPGEADSVPATGEFKRVLQILMNLLTNAIRYSPEGGEVWVRCEREGDLACVIVADQGKGIDPADQARIFAKFERVDPTEAGGTGLGLYIARRLARSMDGDISVHSAPGQGARFTLALPAR